VESKSISKMLVETNRYQIFRKFRRLGWARHWRERRFRRRRQRQEPEEESWQIRPRWRTVEDHRILNLSLHNQSHLSFVYMLLQ
jgi:hypothetical protein